MSTTTPGYITASSFHPLMPKNGLGKGADTFAKQIALERMYLQGLVSEEALQAYKFSSKQTDHGINLENEAVDFVEKEKIISIEKSKENQETIKHDKYWLSCTPDGITKYKEQEILVEFKCPYNPDIHINHLLGEWETQYINQVKFQLMITGAKIGVLYSYDNRFKNTPLASLKIKKDKNFENLIFERYHQFEKIVEEYTKLIG